MGEVLRVLEKTKEEVLKVPYKAKEVEGSRIFKKRKRKRGRRKSKNMNFQCIGDYVNEKPKVLILIILVIVFKNPQCNSSKTKRVSECNHTCL
jgi:hypothetical protein